VAGVEAFTILAILDAKDRISGVMERVDETLNAFASSAERAAEASRVAGTAIDESLLQTASGADALEVAEANLAATQARLSLATEELAGAERQLLAANEQAARSAEGDAVAMAAQSDAAERLAAAQKMLRNVTGEVAAATRVQAATADAAAVAAGTATTGTSRWAGAAATAGVAVKKLGTFTMGAGLAAAAVTYESVKAATSFQTLLTRLVTTAGESKSNLDLVRRGILDISSSVGVSANEVAKGMYTVESAGYHGAAGVQVLRAATEGAAIEGADFATVSNAVTDVLKDYHWTADQAGTATSQLIKAVSYGKTNFQNMSAAMANVLPLASSLHIKLNDVTGVLAEMTAHGMTAARASFNIANAMRSLAKPTNVMEKEFKLFGLTSRQVQDSLSSKGLAGTIQMLSETAHKGASSVGQTYNEALGKLMGTATGLQVALLTTGENTADTNKAIKGIGEASTEAGGHVEGFSELQNTLANRLNRAKAAIHNAGIAIGTALLPAVTKIAGAIANFLTPLASWVQKHQRLTTIVLGSLMALGALAAIISIVSAALTVLMSPVTLVIIAIAALVAGLIYAYKHFKTFHDIVNQVGAFLKTTFVTAWKVISTVIGEFVNTILPALIKGVTDMFNWMSTHSPGLVTLWQNVFNGIKDAVDWFKTEVLGWLRQMIGEFITWWKSHNTEITTVWRQTWETIKVAAKVVWDFLQPLFAIIAANWKTTWDLMLDTIKLVWGLIKDIVTTDIHLVLNVIGVALDVMTGHWSKAWTDLKKLAKQALHDIWGTIKDFGSNAGTLLYDAGKNVIKGLISGIKSMISSVNSAISDVASAIKDHLPWSPAKKGPLSGSGAPEIGGQNIVKMMAQGIVKATPQVEAAMNAVTSTVKARQAVTGSAITAGLVAGAGTRGTTTAGNITYLTFDLRDSRVMSDRDMDLLVNKIGAQVATRILPAGGVRIRM
jgi:TP901 family phage tail tape measure protein